MADPLNLEPELIPFANPKERQLLADRGALLEPNRQAVLVELRRAREAWLATLNPTKEQVLAVTHEENRTHARLNGGNQQFWDGLYADWKRRQKPSAEDVIKAREQAALKDRQAKFYDHASKIGENTFRSILADSIPGDPLDSGEPKPESTQPEGIGRDLFGDAIKAARDRRHLQRREELLAREEALQRQREMGDVFKIRHVSLWPGADEQHARKMQAAFEGKPNPELPKPWHKHRDLVVGILLASGAAIMGLVLWLVSPNSMAKVALALVAIFVLLAFSLGVVVHYLEWKRRYTLVGVLVSLLASAVFGSYVWPKTPTPLPIAPSFVFVKPGVWVNGDTWTFHIEHRGPEPVFNVELLFNDLVAKKDQSFTFAEIDPGNIGLAKYFTWKPTVADHEHYDILISSRNGHIQQTLRLERIAEHWRVATRVTDIDHKRVLLECKDAGFPVDQEWATLSPCFPDYPQKY
jgi:hypothetical protein